MARPDSPVLKRRAQRQRSSSPILKRRVKDPVPGPHSAPGSSFRPYGGTPRASLETGRHVPMEPSSAELQRLAGPRKRGPGGEDVLNSGTHKSDGWDKHMKAASTVRDADKAAKGHKIPGDVGKSEITIDSLRKDEAEYQAMPRPWKMKCSHRNCDTGVRGRHKFCVKHKSQYTRKLDKEELGKGSQGMDSKPGWKANWMAGKSYYDKNPGYRESDAEIHRQELHRHHKTGAHKTKSYVKCPACPDKPAVKKEELGKAGIPLKTGMQNDPAKGGAAAPAAPAAPKQPTPEEHAARQASFQSWMPAPPTPPPTTATHVRQRSPVLTRSKMQASGPAAGPAAAAAPKTQGPAAPDRAGIGGMISSSIAAAPNRPPPMPGASAKPAAPRQPMQAGPVMSAARPTAPKKGIFGKEEMAKVQFPVPPRNAASPYKPGMAPSCDPRNQVGSKTADLHSHNATEEKGELTEWGTRAKKHHTTPQPTTAANTLLSTAPVKKDMSGWSKDQMVGALKNRNAQEDASHAAKGPQKVTPYGHERNVYPKGHPFNKIQKSDPVGDAMRRIHNHPKTNL